MRKPPKSVPQKNFFAENTEIADAIYGTGYIWITFLKLFIKKNESVLQIGYWDIAFLVKKCVSSKDLA